MKAAPSILGVIADRVSARALDPAPLPDADIRALLEAARWAPSWGNLQPWRFIVVRDPQTRAAVDAAFTRGNAWAKTAPLLIVVAANPADGKWRGDEPSYLFDCGLSTQNLILQATHLGLIAHPMGGWEESTVREAIGVPPEVRIVVVIAIGRPGVSETLDERNREKEQRPRERLPLSQIAFADKWQHPLPFVADSTDAAE